MPVRLVADPALTSSPGDFGARLAGETLRLPENVYALAFQSGMTELGADMFVGSVLQHFPNACAAALGWSRADYDRALGALRDLLRPHLSERTLNPTPPRPFATGAPNPRDNPDDPAN